MIKIHLYEADPGVISRLDDFNFTSELSSVSGLYHIEVDIKSLYIASTGTVILSTGTTVAPINSDEFSELVY